MLLQNKLLYRSTVVITDEQAISSEQQSNCLNGWKTSVNSVMVFGSELQVGCHIVINFLLFMTL